MYSATICESRRFSGGHASAPDAQSTPFSLIDVEPLGRVTLRSQVIFISPMASGVGLAKKTNIVSVLPIDTSSAVVNPGVVSDGVFHFCS